MAFGSFGNGTCVDHPGQPSDAGLQLDGEAFESFVRHTSTARYVVRILDAPMERLAVAAELRAVFANLVAERDDVVELLPDEIAQRFRLPASDVDTPSGKDLDRVAVHGFRLASGTDDVHRAPSRAFKQRFGDLGTGAVAGAREQHARSVSRTASSEVGKWRNSNIEPRMQQRAGVRELLTAPVEVDPVVHRPSILRAPPRRHQPTGAKPPEVIRDEPLWFVDEVDHLLDEAITVRELDQHSPPQRMTGKLQKRRRRR